MRKVCKNTNHDILSFSPGKIPDTNLDKTL